MALPNPFSWGTDGNYPAGSEPWSGTAIVSEPAAGKKAAGYAPREQLPAQELNWLAQQVGQITTHLDNPTIPAFVQSATASAASGGTATIADLTLGYTRLSNAMLIVCVATNGTVNVPTIAACHMISLINYTNASVPHLGVYYLPERLIPNSLSQGVLPAITVTNAADDQIVLAAIFSGISQEYQPRARGTANAAGTGSVSGGGAFGSGQPSLKANSMMLSFLVNNDEADVPVSDGPGTTVFEDTASGRNIRISASYQSVVNAGDFGNPSWSSLTAQARALVAVNLERGFF